MTTTDRSTPPTGATASSIISFRFAQETLAPSGPVDESSSTGEFVGNCNYNNNYNNGDVTWSRKISYSVVDAFADTWALFCCGRWSRLGCNRPVTACGFPIYRMSFTRAQWIWLLNLICLAVHAVFAYLCFTSCNSNRFGRVINPDCTPEGMTVHIQRFTIEWDSGDYKMGLDDNNMPIRFDMLTASFFLLSALFHGFAVLIGPFSQFGWLYWEQIDNCLCWWRWLEYSASASVMVMALYVISGLREQNNLAMAFVLIATTQFFGLLTEMYSRPAPRGTDGHRGWVGDPIKSAELTRIEQKKLAFRDRNYLVRHQEATKMFFINQEDQHRHEQEILSQGPMPPTFEEIMKLQDYYRAYNRNYVRRMIPHVLGIFPYVTVWVIFINSFFTQLNDVRIKDEDLFARIPSFVPVAIVGTVVIFTTFTFVQWRYQYLSPDYYWRTEVWYCFLSLTAKVFLGLLLYVNVLMFSSVSTALEQTPNNLATSPPPPTVR